MGVGVYVCGSVETDSYAVLGLQAGASDAEVAAAYRRLAKEWHPDVHGTEAAVRRMVAINAAYEELRARSAAPAAPSSAVTAPPGAQTGLGPELSSALRPGEEIVLSSPTATWNSPEAFLVLTSIRLLWLLDDAVTHRVRSLALSQIASIDVELGRVRRRRATLIVRTRHGRRFAFAELAPATARAIAAAIRGAG
jgi:DnaJ-like protein